MDLIESLRMMAGYNRWMNERLYGMCATQEAGSPCLRPVEELYAGALDSQVVRLVERYVGSLERANRIIAPNFHSLSRY